MSADFSGLRSSIARLVDASKALDVEKEEAGTKFRELLDMLPHHEDPLSLVHGLPEWLKTIIEKIFKHVPSTPVKKFIEAAERVQRANAKVVAFERGFISEDGLKDREWYKHLGVAPGKWLGTCPSYLSCVVRGASVVPGGLRRVARHPPAGAMDDGAPCGW